MKIQEILKEYKDIEYKLTVRKTLCAESFYVKKKLEMNRAVDVTHTFLTVYKVFEENGVKFRGSAVGKIHATATEKEIKQTIEQLTFAASFVKNRWYPLAPPAKTKTEITKINGETLFTTLEKLRETVFSQDNHKNGFLSFSEYFVKRHEIRIINSLGLDVSYTVNEIYSETAVTWKEEKEVEVFGSFVLSPESADTIGDRVKRLFEVAEKKPKAAPTSAFSGNVLLGGEALSTFFGYYTANANAMMVFVKQSQFKCGESVQGENITGDKISITLDPALPGSAYSAPFDADGVRLEKTEIMKDGKLLCYHGNLMGSEYLGIPATGNIRNLVVSGGTHTEKELKTEPYLEIIALSDFQVSPASGDFGSEIRLAYYFDGKTVLPVTGGSISGNINDVQETIKMTKEAAQFNEFAGPKLISLKNVTVSG